MPRPSAQDSRLTVERCTAFGERLRQLRRWRRLSQVALAERAGLSTSYIARLEKGRISPGLIRVWDLADALDLTLLDLLAEGYPHAWISGRPPATSIGNRRGDPP